MLSLILALYEILLWQNVACLHNNKKHLPLNSRYSDSFKQARSILSPYHIFLENLDDINYFATVKIEETGLNV